MLHPFSCLELAVEDYLVLVAECVEETDEVTGREADRADTGTGNHQLDGTSLAVHRSDRHVAAEGTVLLKERRERAGDARCYAVNKRPAVVKSFPRREVGKIDTDAPVAAVEVKPFYEVFIGLERVYIPPKNRADPPEPPLRLRQNITGHIGGDV
ncbi:TPA: hypothetical protein EYP13_03075 [Candidatus Micrarchaeota archaeon]|nr:hypothetical protein [Candidatus Micrarchaeota archaeon]